MRSRFVGGHMGRLPTEELAETENDPSAESAGRGERRSRVSWPETLRAVRGWLEPYIMLWRYWRAFSEMAPTTTAKSAA